MEYNWPEDLGFENQSNQVVCRPGRRGIIIYLILAWMYCNTLQQYLNTVLYFKKELFYQNIAQLWNLCNIKKILSFQNTVFFKYKFQIIITVN